MLDRSVFTREFTLLLERFGRDPHALMTARYFEYVSRHLTTEQFEAAARLIFEEDQFWPAPARFVHAAVGDPKQVASDAWSRLLAAASSGKSDSLGPEVIATLRRSGATFRDVELAGEYRLRELERAFVDAYQSGPALVKS